MKDKFFHSLKERFETHAGKIEEDLKYLDYTAYDHRDALPYQFVGEIEQIKSCLYRMRIIIEEVEKRNENV